MDLIGGLYKNRIDWMYDTMMPHLDKVYPDLKPIMQTMIWFMTSLKDQCRAFLDKARDIKTDYPSWMAVPLPTPPLSKAWGRLTAFSTNGFSKEGQDAWNLDKFEASPGQDQFETFDVPNEADNFRANWKVMCNDIMLYASRLKDCIDDANTIRKNTREQEEGECCEAVQAWLESVAKEITRVLEMSGDFEAAAEATLTGPLTAKEIRRISRKYSWVKAAPLDEHDVRPITRAKVPVADRPLLVRRTRQENINTM